MDFINENIINSSVAGLEFIDLFLILLAGTLATLLPSSFRRIKKLSTRFTTSNSNKDNNVKLISLSRENVLLKKRLEAVVSRTLADDNHARNNEKTINEKNYLIEELNFQIKNLKSTVYNKDVELKALNGQLVHIMNHLKGIHTKMRISKVDFNVELSNHNGHKIDFINEDSL